MTEDFPEAFGALDRRCRASAFESFARDEALIGPVDRHRNELSDFTHESSLGRSLEIFRSSQSRFSAGILTKINLAALHAA
jgi:hypothetical protein